MNSLLFRAVLSVLVLLLGTARPYAADNLPASLAELRPQLPETPFDYTVTLPDHLAALADYATEPPGNPVTNAGATLGRVLFYDRGLSANGLVSCASCHSQESGFDDPNRFSIGFKGRITKRHSAGLAFAGYNSNGRYFRDEHAPTLEEQVLEPVHDPIEMGLEAGELIARVKARAWYSDLFLKAFDSPEITEDRIARALAQFVRSMVSTRSAYDQARALETSPDIPFRNFSLQENLGKDLFLKPQALGGLGCASCHETEAFLMLRRQNNGLDDDAAADAENVLLRGASLRNIAVRAPHMHDGRFASLRQVIDHYSTGIKNHQQLGEPLQDKDGRPIRFNLNLEQKDALEAFLNTLTDPVFLKDPKYSDPFIRRSAGNGN